MLVLPIYLSKVSAGKLLFDQWGASNRIPWPMGGGVIAELHINCTGLSIKCHSGRIFPHNALVHPALKVLIEGMEKCSVVAEQKQLSQISTSDEPQFCTKVWIRTGSGLFICWAWTPTDRVWKGKFGFHRCPLFLVAGWFIYTQPCGTYSWVGAEPLCNVSDGFAHPMQSTFFFF